MAITKTDLKKAYPKGQNQKIIDTGNELPGFSSLDKYWKREGFAERFLKLRPGFDISKFINVFDAEKSIINKFKLKGFEYGNWVTNEDRFNYLCACTIALYDLNKVLNFGLNMGLNRTLGIAFGSRGRGKALAHFEPGNFVINLTRYNKDTVEQTKRANFIATGGVGSLAHEYGHFLDYFFGTFVEQRKGYCSLTNGRSINNKFPAKKYVKSSLIGLTENVIKAIVYDGKEESSYYKQLLTIAAKDDYWYRQNELFARAFEQWVQYKLQKSGINNYFLAKSKYGGWVYMKPKEFQRVLPHLDALMREMSRRVTGK